MARAFVAIQPLAIPLLLILAVVALLLTAEGRMEANPRFRVDPLVYAFERPEWLPEALAADIAWDVGTGLGPPASLLDADDLSRWHAQVAGLSPWIEAVPSVEPRFPYRAALRLVLRRPVLELQGQLVSADGTVLGPAARGVLPSPLLLRDGDLDIDAAQFVECAASAGELLPYRAELVARGLDFTDVRVSQDGLVVFGSTAGVDVVWGRSTRYHQMARHDLPPARRIELLHEALDHRPRLEGVGRVDIYLDKLRVHPGP